MQKGSIIALSLGSQYKSEKLHQIIQYYSNQVNKNLHQLGFVYIGNERVHFKASKKKKVLLTNTACLARLFIEFTKRSRRTQCDWAQVAAWFSFQNNNNNLKHFLDTRRNLNIHKTLIRRADDVHKDIHKAFT